MGKLAKQRRTKTWKLEQKVRELQLALRTRTNERDVAEASRARLERGIRQSCQESTLLWLEKKQSLSPHEYRVALMERHRNARAYWADPVLRFDHMPIEEVMHILSCDPAVRDDFSRRLHFRIENAPGGRSFAFGYAVSHTELKYARMDGAHFARFIGENIGAAIYKALFPEDAKR